MKILLNATIDQMLISSLNTAAEIIRLGLEAQNVIALRTKKVAAGGRAASLSS